MFRSRMTLFRVAGVSIRVDASWIIPAVLVTWSLAASFYPTQYRGLARGTYWTMGAIGALGLFASILFHELSQALIARSRDRPPRPTSSRLSRSTADACCGPCCGADADRLLVPFVARAACTPEMILTADTDAVDALARMHRVRQSRLLVMEGDRLTGILTRKDLLRFLALRIELEERPR